MIPEKIQQAHVPEKKSHLDHEIHRNKTLTFIENGKTVATFTYDKLSSAVSLVSEMQVLTQIKFSQIEIVDNLLIDEKSQTHLFSRSSSTNRGSLSSCCNDIDKILAEQIEKSKLSQMPCSLILLAASINDTYQGNDDEALLDISSFISQTVTDEDMLFWFPLHKYIPGIETTRNKSQLLDTAFCLILPATGLLKSKMLVNEIKKYQSAGSPKNQSISLYSGIGVKTPAKGPENLLDTVCDYLTKSIHNNGRVFSSSTTSSGSQVSVEERTQLFKISQRTTV